MISDEHISFKQREEIGNTCMIMVMIMHPELSETQLSRVLGYAKQRLIKDDKLFLKITTLSERLIENSKKRNNA